MCLAEFKGFAQLCLCRRVRSRNFVFPALVTAFSPRALLGFGVFKMRRVLVRKVPNIMDRSRYTFGGKLALFMRFGTFSTMKAKQDNMKCLF